MRARRIFIALAALLLAPAAAFAQASPSPYTSAKRNDAAGRVTGMIAPDPDGTGPLNYAAVRNTYDAAGRLTRVETGELAAWQSEAVAPASWSGFTIFRTVETTYDAMGRKISDSVREGAAGTARALTQYSYDALGRLECTAVRMNPAAFASAPAACALGTQGSDGPDRITRNVYDVWGQLLQVQRAYLTSFQQNEVTYTYSANGKRTSVTDANGNRAEMTWDGLDRQTRWTFPSPTTPGTANASDYEEYGYDANANRTSLRKRDGSTLTYTYDALNRATVKTVPERAGLDPSYTRDVYYSYDLRGLQLSARFDSQSGEGVTNAYDGFGRLASSSINMSGVTRTNSFQYDANGNRIVATHADGTPFTFTYDALGRMTGSYLGLGTATILTTQSYAANGQLSAIARRYGDSGTYGYDGIGSLTALSHAFVGGAGNVAFSYARNPAGQITSRTRSNDAYAWGGAYNVSRGYSVNGLNQYTAAATASFAYDANGNLTSDGANAYVYDVENRLVSASGGHSATLRYDPLGRLFEVANASGTTRFVYDGDDLVDEYNGVGTWLRRYVHGGGTDDPLVWWEGNDLRFPHADERGSVIGYSNNTAALAGIDSYDEWGIPGIANQGRFQYTGQAWLAELGMYYYKARIYSPTLGRFLQTDPIGYADQFNLYEYVGDDPINRTDPTGRYICTGSKGECTAFTQTMIRVKEASLSRNLTHSQSERLQRVMRTYGPEGRRNGVVVDFRTPVQIRQMNAHGIAVTVLDVRNREAHVTLPHDFATLYDNYRNAGVLAGGDPSRLRNMSPENERADIVAHEGVHAFDEVSLGRNVSEQESPGRPVGGLVHRAFGSTPVDPRDE